LINFSLFLTLTFLFSPSFSFFILVHFPFYLSLLLFLFSPNFFSNSLINPMFPSPSLSLSFLFPAFSSYISPFSSSFTFLFSSFLFLLLYSFLYPAFILLLSSPSTAAFSSIPFFLFLLFPAFPFHWSVSCVLDKGIDVHDSAPWPTSQAVYLDLFLQLPNYSFGISEEQCPDF
jgi:hypothetical protein